MIGGVAWDVLISVLVEEEHDNADWGDPKQTPDAPVELTSMTSDDGPNMNSSMTWGPLKPESTKPRGIEVAVEGEATFVRDSPCHIQRDHLPQ